MENKKLPATSCGKTSLTVNKEKSLSSWIVSASKKPAISKCSDSDIRKMIAYVMILVGFKEKPQEAETFVIMDFIKSRLGRFSIEEFKVAYTLFVEGKLDIQQEHYNSFSSIYLSRVMDSYSRYRFNHLKDHRLAIEEEQEKVKPYGPIEIENLIIKQFDRFLSGKEIYDFGGVQYRYLVGMDLIKLTKEQKADIMLQAKEIFKLQNLSLAGKILSPAYSEEAVIAIARLISLKSYFQMLKRNKDHIALVFNRIRNNG